MWTPEIVRQAWAVMRDMSVEELSRIYRQLDVEMSLSAYRGESFYGGAEQPDGMSHPDGNVLQDTVIDSLSTIGAKGPIGKSVSKSGQVVVWSTGTSKPSYWYNEPYGCYRDVPEFKTKRGKYKGQLIEGGTCGPGVTYGVACILWGKTTVDSLPVLED